MVFAENLISRKPYVYHTLKGVVCLGFLDDPKLKQVNLKKLHTKVYGFNLWTWEQFTLKIKGR